MASTCAALLLVAVALLVVHLSRKLFKQHKLNLPPGPSPLPIIGSLHLFGTHPHQSLAGLAQKYGPVMSIQLGQKSCVVATSPEAAQEFLKLQDANFSSRPHLRCIELIAPQDIVFHDITPVTSHLRKIIVSELTSAKRLKASKYIRTEELAHMLRSISKETGPIQVKTFFYRMSTNILTRMVLNKRFLCQGQGDDHNAASEMQEFTEIIEEANYCMAAVHLKDVFNFIPKWLDPQGLDTRFRKLKARLDKFHINMVNQHREERRKNPISEEQKTFLDVMLEQLDNSKYEITEELIKGAIWNNLFAGTDTTMVTSEWAMAEVLRCPSVMKEARAELDRVVGLNRTVQESDIPDLKYIQAIVKETMRLHSIVPLLAPHQSIDATKAFGFDIPAKTRLFVNWWGIGRDPQVWENPLEFVPERFLDGAPHAKTEFHGQHFEFIPFGSGRRKCVGISFAALAVHIQVANFLHAFEWSLPTGLSPQMLDMAEGTGMAMQMQNPLVAIAKPRLPPHVYEG
ncbi:hypothetical protein KC19_1G143900 [Ceratodon purpureus]|uniref:Cytochrome P450 n=1 Tax=Ceratodon purpureus TaxID=3225 RepID=A0A8T0J8F5_CERPU|nr:hypothetical protein KC19_1G143900 [Ceratodon purpureus]